MDLFAVLNGIFPAVDWKASEIKQYLSDAIFYRYMERVALDDKFYYLSIYRHEEHIFMEVEVCNSDYHFNTTRLYYYTKYLEQGASSTWQALTTLVREIIGFDRVMVYRFLDDFSGQVVAESKAETVDSLVGFGYPEFDISANTRILYTNFLARHVYNIDGPVYQVRSRSRIDLDLSKCSLRALSPIHLQYLRNSGAKASASFSILIDGKLWGLIACQHRTPMHVDLSQRHLCNFLTQYAVNFNNSELRRENACKQKMIDAVEKELKAELILEGNIYSALNKFAGEIMRLTDADGMALRCESGLKAWGTVPDHRFRGEIDAFLAETDYSEIFCTDAFDYKEQENSSLLTLYPGILTGDALSDNKCRIYLFRKEYVYEQVWAARPEKGKDSIVEEDKLYPSLRASFEAWNQIIKGRSLRWEYIEIGFFKRIIEIIQQGLARRGGENNELNKRLIRANNAMDTFSYTLTHDLKNPLSSIQLAAQMMLTKDNISGALLKKLGANVLDATKLIMEMLDKVYYLSQANYVAVEGEVLDPRSKILAIVEQGMLHYNMERLDFTLGETFPIYGERTLLYQLFLNLITNAIKYSSKEQQPKLSIYSEKKSDTVIYFIEDNGIGMDLKSGGDIFDIFKRLPNSQGYEGSGIGLSIVKRIADRLDAVIKVDSELNVGTVFQIAFKINR